jgi:hypothetical protein
MQRQGRYAKEIYLVVPAAAVFGSEWFEHDVLITKYFICNKLAVSQTEGFYQIVMSLMVSRIPQVSRLTIRECQHKAREKYNI